MVVLYRRKCMCQIRLSNCKQFCHDTIKTSSMFTFTISFCFSTMAELYLNLFTTRFTRLQYLSSPLNLKHVDFAIDVRADLSTVFSLSPFQLGTIVMGFRIAINQACGAGEAKRPFIATKYPPPHPPWPLRVWGPAAIKSLFTPCC